MHSVCQTHAFARAARAAGLSERSVAELVTYLAENPAAGAEMPGTGGCRKLRWAGRGKGKRGGYRVITFFSGAALPVFLITVFGKNEKATLTQSECNALKKLTRTLVEQYRVPEDRGR